MVDTAPQADLVSAVQDGKVYVNIDTRLNTTGAIRGDLEVRGQDEEQNPASGGATKATSAAATSTGAEATATATATPTDAATNPGKDHANSHADQMDQAGASVSNWYGGIRVSAGC
jgi:hypothetical protein